ncbi:putative peptidase YuxL [Ktedonobacteria bacterium brp13]|nr:putative peptidase YuxL [Ktedonobacteria bacterium brp13]
MARSITIEDLYKVKFAGRPRISPDGQQVAYVETTIDEQAHKYRSSIWIAPVTGGEPRRFTAGPANANDPQWSPDGRWLAFVSERKGEPVAKDADAKEKLGIGKPQIWLLPVDGGEARQLTFMEHGASSPIWSPDSKQIVFSAQVGPQDEKDAEGNALPKVRVIDNLWNRLDGVGFIHTHRSHLFLIEATGGEPRQLTDGDWNDGDAAWSPDGTRIAFISDRSEERWRWPVGDIYTLTIQNNDLQKYTDSTLGCISPSWSSDGKKIAFLASPKFRSAGQVYLYTILIEGQDHALTNLSPNFEGSCSEATNSDMGDEHMAPPPVWSADDQSLYVLATHRGASRVFTFASTTPTEKPATLTPGEVHVRDFSIDAAKKTISLLLSDTLHPGDIFISATDASSEPRALTHVNESLLNDLTLSHPEQFAYEGADGWSIDGWVMKPQDFDPAKKYPLVVEIHGGPQTQYGYGFFHEMQLLVAQGYIVLYTNPRGSLGYGFDFADAVRKDWGERPGIDIMKGLEAVVKEGYVDEERIAVTGGSYGGYMTNWLVGHYDTFKVAVTDRCVSNLASMFGSSDLGWDLSVENLDTTPWESLDEYMEMSPIKYVQNIHTPLLIIHSEQDLRCNIEQADQLFASLKWLGREVRMVRFEGQSHGLSRGGHPHSRLERLRHITSWFAKYLQ